MLGVKWRDGAHLPTGWVRKSRPMKKTIQVRTFLVHSGVLVVCLVVGAATSLFLGQDSNWDLRNYHLYNGYAALNHRLGTDIAAAGLQSWINPTLDIPYAWLALGPLATHPKILTAIMGLWYGVLVAVILGLSWALYRFLPGKLRWAATAMATAMAATGAATFSQAGRTFNEVQTATLILSAVWLLTSSLGDITTSGRRGPALAAGVLLGAASGLKITSVIFAPAVLIALVLTSRRSLILRNASLLVLGGIVGLLISGGWWALKLYQAYGNPVFPFFNGIFHSAWYPPVNWFDHRFLPHNFWEALFYPLFWIPKNIGLVTEIPFRDWRMAIAFMLALALITLSGIKYSIGRAHEQSLFQGPLGKSQLFLLLFASSSYVLWICSTAILRYAIPVEASLTIVIPLLLWLLLHPAPDNKIRTMLWLVLNLVIVLLALVTTHYPNWGRMPYGSRVVSVDMRWVPHGALVVIVGAPIAYVVPFTSPDIDASFVGLTDVVFASRGYKLADEVVRRIATHRGPPVVVWENTDRWRLPSLPDMGLEMLPLSCRSFFGSFEIKDDRGLHWCRGHAHISRPLTSAFWKQAAKGYDEIEVPEPVDGWSYIGFRIAAGETAAGKHYVDDFENLWSRQPGRPKNFDDRILAKTLYILNPSLKSRALRAMNKSRDLLATIDGILVLAPGWRGMPGKRAG